MDTLITVVSGLASIAGALISIWQARKSKKSAETARLTLKHIREHKRISEISKLKLKSQSAIRTMEKYGSSSPGSLAGVDIKKDAGDVQSFITALSEQKNHFTGEDRDAAVALIDTLEKLLSKFTASEEFQGVQPFGREVLSELNRFSSRIKCLDDKYLDALNDYNEVF